MMWKYAALVSYVGLRYCGWQKQKGSAADGDPSIQATMEESLSKMTSEEVTVVGSGRTDSGVNATGQVIHFVLRKKEWDPQIIRKGMNGLLPRDIQVLSVQRVPIEFHAQRSATKKQYSYYFQQGSCALPHLNLTSWWIKKKLDIEAMQQALVFLTGEHDFKPFQASGAKPGPTVRKILEAQVCWEPLVFPGTTSVEGKEIGFVRMRVVGTGFLKQMVRSIAGTLLQIGEGRRPPECIREILETRNRGLVGPTAPARALWLEQVWYDGLKW